MPIYEYRCNNCGYVFEQLFLREHGQILCPLCNGVVKKLMSPFSIAIPDEICSKLPKGERRELCTECKHGGSACSAAVQ